jgi:hypothetical protein
MHCMALKVYTCQEAASWPKTFLNIFLQQNEPSPAWQWSWFQYQLTLLCMRNLPNGCNCACANYLIEAPAHAQCLPDGGSNRLDHALSHPVEPAEQGALGRLVPTARAPSPNLSNCACANDYLIEAATALTMPSPILLSPLSRELWAVSYQLRVCHTWGGGSRTAKWV